MNQTHEETGQQAWVPQCYENNSRIVQEEMYCVSQLRSSNEWECLRSKKCITIDHDQMRLVSDRFQH